jgi:hypothetical protein
MIDSLLVPRRDKCVLDSLPIAPVCQPCTQVTSSPYPLAFFRHWRDAPTWNYPRWFKALAISTHTNSQTLTKHVPFASIFPLLKWKQVMRLSFFSSCAYSSEFYPPDCYQLSSARTYSLLRNDPPSRSPSIRLSPLGLYLPYLVRVCVKETTRLPSVICTFYSIHPDPNHVDEPCRSYPFVCFPARYTPLV